MKFISNRIAGNFQRFNQQTCFLFKAYLIALLLFFISRIIFITCYGNFNELKDYKSDVMVSFITGARFDTVVTAYGLLLLMAISVICFFLPSNKTEFQKIIDRFFVSVTVIIFSLLFIIVTADFYFYRFFSSHFNVLVFGLADDDTRAILKSVWTDYPVIRLLLCWTFMIITFSFFFRKMYYKRKCFGIDKAWARSCYFIFFTGLFGLSLRCSFGNVPLEYMECSVSGNSFINHITMNGVFALKNAFSERSKGEIDISESCYLQKFNYTSSQEIINDYCRHLDISNDCSMEGLSKRFTPVNSALDKDPPNIIFLQMESMSSYFFKLQSPTFNVLGSLEKELDKCIVFKNFVSCRNLTILSLDGLISNSPLSPISQSEYLNTSFESSAILPFVNRGYETVFATGGRMNWRNLDQYLPRQGFQKLEGGADIMQNNPRAIEEHEWGVYDEFLMDRIIYLINNKRDKPLFVYGMTITYHTPYKIPDSYKSYPLAFDDNFKTAISCKDEKTLETFRCYQYMCNALGDFIHKVSTSKAGDNTIIIATGDHSSHVADQYFNFGDSRMMDWYGVPLICYIPEKYRKGLYIDNKRFGSHKDIFPTLYNLCLNNAPYYNGGNNLFSADTSALYYGLYEGGTVFSKYGCSRYGNGAFDFFGWKDETGGDLVHLQQPGPQLTKCAELARASSAFNTYNIIKQITDGRITQPVVLKK
jgi:phosphoglycerol transferase MdoB-like AlkP superfamily enzyme